MVAGRNQVAVTGTLQFAFQDSPAMVIHESVSYLKIEILP